MNDSEERALEIEVLRLNAELYEYQTDVSAGRTPPDVEVHPAARLRQAVGELAKYHGSITHMLADLDQEADNLAEGQGAYEVTPEIRMRWVTRTMNDVRTGDRIKLRGTEAVVETAYGHPWHVHPSSKYTVIPLEHGDVLVRLVGRDKAYRFTPDLAVDIHLTEDEIAWLDREGWETRICVITEAVSKLTSGLDAA